MNVNCNKCKTKLNIPDHKIPKNKESSVTCPKCKGKITINAAKPSKQPGEKKKSPPRRSFENRLNSLVCIGEAGVQKKVSQNLKQMGFDVDAVQDYKTAISKMEYHIYNLVILDETFDQNTGAMQVVQKMNTIDMSLRRRICLVLLSSKFQTNDNMAALHNSVNNILHIDEISHIESFLTKAVLEHKNLYTVYNESLKLAGKA